MNRDENFECHALEDGSLFFRGILPQQLRVDADGFEALWRLHPEEYHIIKMHGRLVAPPRWPQLECPIHLASCGSRNVARGYPRAKAAEPPRELEGPSPVDNPSATSRGCRLATELRYTTVGI
jgi:hypothetical protein